MASRCLGFLFGAMMAVCAWPASANDGFGALAAGGVVVGHTDQIAMVKEELRISQAFIHVFYVFENESDHEVSEIISFPLPPYPATPKESGVIAHGQPESFVIKVDDRPVPFETHVWAVMEDGRDVTDQLKALGFSQQDIAMTPFEKSVMDSHELTRPPEVMSKLLAAGLIDKDKAPQWIIKVAYEWRQNFPAHQPIKVYHGYQPFTSEGSWDGYSPDNNDRDDRLKKDFCASDATLHKLRALYRNPDDRDDYHQVPGTTVEYVLTTGNTWKDGIRDFTLRLEKQAPFELMALCLDAPLERKSGTVFESHIRNFHPKADLKIYFGNSWYGGGGHSMKPSFDGHPSHTPELEN